MAQLECLLLNVCICLILADKLLDTATFCSYTLQFHISSAAAPQARSPNPTCNLLLCCSGNCIVQGVPDILNQFAQHVNEIADSIPNQPALSNITSSLQARSQQLANASNDLLPAVAQFISGPSNITAAAVNDFNDGLVQLL